MLALSGIDHFHGFSLISHVLAGVAVADVHAAEHDCESKKSDCIEQTWIESQHRYFVAKVAALERSSIRVKILKQTLFLVILLTIMAMFLFDNAVEHYQLLGEPAQRGPGRARQRLSHGELSMDDSPLSPRTRAAGEGMISGEWDPRIDRIRLARLRAAEDAEFARRTKVSQSLCARAAAHLPMGVPMSWMSGLYRTAPIYISGGSGPAFRDVDGNEYLDFNLCDLSMTMGFGNETVASALAGQARRGVHYLLPTEDAIVVAELLAQRTRIPYWQFTLSASGANTEVIRVARFMTGRHKIVLFGGHYHGHIEETLVREEHGRSVPETEGLAPGSAAHTKILPFNDLDSLERTLAAGDVALVLTEPALTNCNVILPNPEFHSVLRELTRRHGTLLCIDEAHTFQFDFGGLTNSRRLSPDFVVLGKGLGSGVPFGLYGMSEPVADVFARHLDVDIGPRGIATGGTTYATALAAAVARAALERVLTSDTYARVRALGARLSDGLQAEFTRRALPWRAFRCGPRSGFCLAPTLPMNGAEAARSLDFEFIDARRVYMANRGIWDAVAGAGPQTCLAHSASDIDRYIAAAGAYLDAVTQT